VRSRERERARLTHTCRTVFGLDAPSLPLSSAVKHVNTHTRARTVSVSKPFGIISGLFRDYYVRE
jgi:hypothetical protein